MAVQIQTAEQLCTKKCVPCEGGVPKLTPSEAEEQIRHLAGWQLTSNHERIRKTWVVKNFMAAMNFLNHVACVAECDGHHPDVHIERYRNVTIELYTHAIGGLSENDFILAAKIDALPVALKTN
jgi:4a-hydroxytetrahydrobiopterin dehydratase